MMNVCILGASGSIGTQTIDVMIKNPNDFNLVSFSVGNKTRKIVSILKKYPNIKHICIKEKTRIKYYSKHYPNINFYYGDNGLLELIEKSNPQMVVNSLVGFAGLRPTIKVLEDNRILCLANKESLVVGGELINDLLSKGKGKLYPIDSEHVALAKCLAVESKNVNKLIITASGGAFRKLSRKELENVTPEMALNHPTWNMGNKITIDSASMVNKTFEIIEAHYLYNYPAEKIDVMFNFESYVHSLVEYNDGSYRLDVGKPDMRNPIKYALYQGLTPFNTLYTKTLFGIKNVNFYPFDEERFPIVRYARTVMEKKGIYGAVLNASNEEAVYAFLNHKIKFLDIEDIITRCMESCANIIKPSYEVLERVDKETREQVRRMIKGGL